MQLTDLSFLFDDNPNPMWVYQLSTLNILKVNKAATAKYGYSEREFLGMRIIDLRPKEDQEKLEKYLIGNKAHQSALKGIMQRGTWKHLDKFGNFTYAEITSHNIQFENIDCRVVIAADVSEKVFFREELTWTKSNLEALINNTEDQIWSVDKEMRYVYMNRAYRKQIELLTGSEPKYGEFSYQNTGFDEAGIEEWDRYYRRALNGERYTIIYENLAPVSQKVISFEISFNPIYKIKGDITGVGCFARDITDLLDTEKAITDQNERLRNIASLTSHELRRPVASMLGLINIMDRVNFYNPDNQEIIEHLLTVGNEIDEVIRLIVDKTFMGDLSKDGFGKP